MCADDLMLLALSLKDMQLMVNICADELFKLDLKPNPKKISCLKIGNRWNVNLSNIMIDKVSIPWCTEITYLGIVMLAGKSLKFDFHLKKAKYFGALNNVLGKIGNSSNACLVLSLVSSKCNPILGYGLEAIRINNSTLNNISYVFNAVYTKLFGSFDKSVIAQCQWYCGYLPLCYDIDLKKMHFLNNLLSGSSPASIVFKREANIDLLQLTTKYRIDLAIRDGATRPTVSWKRAVWSAFEASLQIVNTS